MRTLILLVISFTINNSFSQEVSDTITITNTGSHVIIVDIHHLDSLILASNKEYKIVFKLSNKCHSSLESFPVLIDYISQYPDKFELFPIIGDRYSEIPSYEAYLQYLAYNKPIYILDVEKYGNKRNPSKKLDKVVKALCHECNYRKMGFSSFFVFDQLNSIVLHNTWKVVGLEKINQLKELPL